MDNTLQQDIQSKKVQIPKDKSQSNSEDEADKGDTKKMSKAQKKKARLQRKKEQESKKASQNLTQIKVQEKKEQNTQTKPTQQLKKQQQQDKKELKGKKKKEKPLNAAAKLALERLEKQKKQEEEELRQKKLFEEQLQRERIAEQLRKKKEQQQLQKQIALKRLAKILLKLIQLEKQRQQLEQIKILTEQQKNIIPIQKTEQQIKAKELKIKKIQQHIGLRDDKDFFVHNQMEYRSPVCCILGHVDTGKTTLLDKIRNTNVQEGQAGGITQQIGATFFPQNKLIQEVEKCSSFKKVNVNVPGLLIIDTPGHQSFSNLRSRGSSLCDVAILVIDLMHGLQNQTLESLQLLKKNKTPFIVALNKIDRCYGWQAVNDTSSYLALKKQKPQTVNDFDTKLKKIILQLNEKGYNATLYWKNQEPQDYISLVPTSGITGEGLPDLLSQIVQYSLTDKTILKKIKVKPNVFSCTVMEVKVIEGHGTTIDCILVDGTIKKQDQIVLLGFQGPIITKVKAILTPHPMKEMRVKNQYLQHKFIHAANGLKISANNLDEAVAGTPLIVANTPDEVEQAIAICENEYESVKKKIKLSDLGVGVAASTLGSLEALIGYLSKQKIPVSHVSVGPVSKDDVIKAMKSMLSQIPDKRKKQFSCLLVFDVKVLPDAQKYAQQNQIKIFSANIIYHLTGFFNKYVEQVRLQRRQREGKEAVFPCVLKQVQTFRKSGPIVLGVDVEEGVLKIGTPLCVLRDKQRGDKQLKLGVVESIEHNHKKIKQARKATGSVAIALAGDPKIQSGKNFEEKDRLVSIVTRRSIDCLKEHYREQVLNQQWHLIVALKKYFKLD